MKAVVGMSGGVDSSVAALLAKEAGLDPVGCMLLLHDFAEGSESDARAVADLLGIPFYTLDLRQAFREQVVRRFIEGYESGVTPNPCIDCNRYMKFSALLDWGKTLGADTVVSGHYARLSPLGDRLALRKAKNPEKDQSYVLACLTQEQLHRVRFPLGDLAKEEVRELARAASFTNAARKESQDICFVPDGDYATFLSRETGKTYPEGNFVSPDGRILGKHKGTVAYTLGQRKGLGVAAGHPVYVTKIDLAENTVTLGENEDLFSRSFTVTNVNYVSIDPQTAPFRAAARVRYRQKEAPATVTPLENGDLAVTFDEPVRAITPGQTAVLYDADLVLASGTIKRD